MLLRANPYHDTSAPGFPLAVVDLSSGACVGELLRTLKRVRLSRMVGRLIRVVLNQL